MIAGRAGQGAARGSRQDHGCPPPSLGWPAIGRGSSSETRASTDEAAVLSARGDVRDQPAGRPQRAAPARPRPGPGTRHGRAFAQINETDARTWLTYLSSDLMQGRQVFTEGYGLAASYIAGELKALGVNAPRGPRHVPAGRHPPGLPRHAQLVGHHRRRTARRRPSGRAITCRFRSARRRPPDPALRRGAVRGQRRDAFDAGAATAGRPPRTGSPCICPARAAGAHHGLRARRTRPTNRGRRLMRARGGRLRCLDAAVRTPSCRQSGGRRDGAARDRPDDGVTSPPCSASIARCRRP